MIKLINLIFIIIFLAISSVFASDSNQNLLIQKALKLDLANDPDWLNMLYYEKSAAKNKCRQQDCKGFESIIDSASFFLAPNGKHNPQKELAATISSFFSTQKLPFKNIFNQEQTAQCAFKGRFEWLKHKLQFSEAELATQKCPEFEEWYREINPKKATLIFSSAYLNNPASMFGHTFLLMSSNKNEKNLLLANAINYSASTVENNGVIFAFKGLFGFYKGQFGIAPYHQMIKKYNDFENRDLWEYELNLSQAEIRKIMTNLWELSNNYASYYFFTDNCSYLLLKLLKVAKPEIQDLQRPLGIAIPSDSVITILKTPNLIKKTHYRPSRASKIKYLAAQMSEENLKLVKKIVAQKFDKNITTKTTQEQKAIYDLAFEYEQYSYQKNGNKNRDELAKNSFSILQKRSQLSGETNLEPIKIPDSNPVNAQAPQRLFVGFGYNDLKKSFTQIDFRPAYHDLLDADSGFLAGAQINVLDLSLRHFSDKNDLELNHLNVVDIKSYSPTGKLIKPISWQLKVGVENFYQQKTDYKNTAFAELGMGSNFELSKIDSNVTFLLNGISYYNEQLPQANLIGVGPQINLISGFGKSLKLQLNISNNLFFDHPDFNYWQYKIEQNFQLQKNVSVKAGYVRSDFRLGGSDEINVGVNFYF